MKGARAVVLAAVLVVGGAGLARGDVLLDVSGEVGPKPESKVERFPLEVAQPRTKLALDLSATLTEGEATFRVLGPDGTQFFGRSSRKRLEERGTVTTPAKTGTFQVEVSMEAAVGKWRARIIERPEPPALPVFLITGPAMVLVALGSVVYWKRRSGTQLRWFWAGAGIWTVGVALKAGWSIVFDRPLLEGLEKLLARVPYVLVGGTYVGLETGVFEIGITLAAALIWRRMARGGSRAVAVGVGAGAFEALLLGVAAFGGTALALAGWRGGEVTLDALARTAAVTPLAWLVGPVERLLTILCHTSSRTLVLLSVASRRWSLFWWGFALMSGVDAIAGFAHLSGAVGRASLWWMELAVAPFALVSVPVIRWCLARWPQGRPPTGEGAARPEGSDVTA